MNLNNDFTFNIQCGVVTYLKELNKFYLDTWKIGNHYTCEIEHSHADKLYKERI